MPNTSYPARVKDDENKKSAKNYRDIKEEESQKVKSRKK